MHDHSPDAPGSGVAPGGGGPVAPAVGPEMWRSLEELARTPEARAVLARAAAAAPLPDGVDRRSFLQLMGASLALAGLACTRQPIEKIVPYVKQPEEIVPGRPLYYASAVLCGGAATGVLVETHQGRPTKVEGNPDHPASLGASDRFMQAAILDLYDPDRSQVLTYLLEIATWPRCVEELRAALASQAAVRGAGVRLLTPTVTSPTLAGQIEAFLAAHPEAKWVQYEADNEAAALAGARIAFGMPLVPRYELARADVILTLDSDFLATGPGNVRYARDCGARRRLESAGSAGMNRLYAVEICPTSSGALADHRLTLRPRLVPHFAAALAATIGTAGIPMPAIGFDDRTARWLAAVARDLVQHRGRSLVVPGAQQPAAVHALAHAINVALGNVGATVTYGDPIAIHPTDQQAELTDLVADMRAGRVDTLMILGSNPVYDAPADLRFAEAMAKVRWRFHHGLHHDETAELCHWHVPATHPFECWSDARAYDGTLTVLQPLIQPLYDGHSAHDVLAAMLGRAGTPGLDLVREHWMATRSGADFDAWWRLTLHDGIAAGTQFPAREVGLREDAVRAAVAALPPSGAGDLEIALRPDPNIGDGRHANNGWLQELPKPWSKLTWDNAALMSPQTAAQFQVENGDVVRLRSTGGEVEAPVWVLPGHAEQCITAHLGYGRRRSGRIGTGAGFDAYRLRTTDTPWDALVTLERTGRRATLVSTQEHHSMQGRDLVRVATAAQVAHGDAAGEHGGESAHGDLSLYPPHPYDGYSWGMSIDLGACTGCNACVVACHAENNVPIVGKDQVRRGREMHWIRIDRYFDGDPATPEVHHQPVLCMHCENAPCEVVCPVAATTHSPEGLNEMTYNRCVGTRYCSNNCPYKVRRFNFYPFSDTETPVLDLMRNPDVTIRTRGVMEKCTYCVQRINQVRQDTKVEGRSIRDGDVVTACQQACPTEAIVFGDINDPHSRVARRRADPRHYGLLEELNTRPRTTYLTRTRNPNPELEAL